MEIEQLIERRNQIAKECEMEGADLNALEEEVRKINDELEQRKQQAQAQEEQRKQVAQKQNYIEKQEGEKTMELVTRDSQVYKNAWLRKLMGKEMNEEERNALVESRAFSSANTYAVPTAIADEVVECLKKFAPLIDEIDLYTASGTIRVPYESVVSEASAHTENASITASSDALLYVDLAGTEIVKITEVSKNALAQSESKFEQWLTRQIARKIADAIDSAIVTAIAGGTYTNNTNAIIDTNGASYTNLCNLVGLLPATLDNGAKFVCNKTVLWSIKGLVGTDKRPIFDPTSNTLLGYPVVVDDYVTGNNSTIYFGNFYEGIKGVQAGEIEVESNEYGAGWDKAMVSFRGYTTFACAKVGTKAVLKFSTTN